MRIHIGISVSGKVLCAGRCASILHALHKESAIERHLLRILAKGAVMDYRIVGIIVYIYIGSIIYLKAQIFALLANGIAGTVNHSALLYGAKLHLLWEGRYLCPVAHLRAPLAIQCNQQRNLCKSIHSIDALQTWHKLVVHKNNSAQPSLNETVLQFLNPPWVLGDKVHHKELRHPLLQAHTPHYGVHLGSQLLWSSSNLIWLCGICLHSGEG